MKDGPRWWTYCKVLDCLGTVLLGLLVGLSVLGMADGLVTLVDEMNLKGAALLVRKVFGLGAEGAGGRRWPIASNRLLSAISTPKWVLAASETLRHILDFLSIASWGEFMWQFSICQEEIYTRW